MPSGGKRAGAGRPKGSSVALRDARSTQNVVSALKRELNSAIAVLSANYTAVLEAAIQAALKGDASMMRLIVEMPFKLISLGEQTKSGIAALREKWTYEKSQPIADFMITDEQTENNRPTEPTEHKALSNPS